MFVISACFSADLAKNKACINLLLTCLKCLKMFHLCPQKGTTQSRRSRSSQTRQRTCDWGSRASCRVRYTQYLQVQPGSLRLDVATNPAGWEKNKALLGLAWVCLGVVLSGQHGGKQGSCPLGGGFTRSPWVATWQPGTRCQVPAVLDLGHVLNIQAKYQQWALMISLDPKERKHK